MATAEQIAALRRMIDDNAEPYTYSNEELGARLDAADASLESVSAVIWREKAASFATLVDVSESGSSRKLSDLRKGALEMAAYYEGKVAEVVAVTASRPRTRPIVRPTP